jgi:hypothetical protein
VAGPARQFWVHGLDRGLPGGMTERDLFQNHAVSEDHHPAKRRPKGRPSITIAGYGHLTFSSKWNAPVGRRFHHDGG